jgi:hypothetical protein
VGEINRDRIIKAATEEQRVKPMISPIAGKEKQVRNRDQAIQSKI